ncbi:MAG: peptidoglycan DD-metalloendopeptidase family protein [Bacteroidales bacterium]|nr:peptidoglycan DD-metalloendopeptidase family protein [Bacteroidales bacterium]
MIRKSASISLVMFLLLSISATAQIHERGMMRNRTNVETNASNYTVGLLNDTNKIKNNPLDFISQPTYVIDENDAAAESEDDILYASFDENAIHYPKFDYSNLVGTIPVKLLPNKNEKFVCPKESILTSHFGPRRRGWHYGVDIALHVGDPIKAMFNGKVRVTKATRQSGGYGNLVVIRHDNGLETYYGHLSRIDVEPGQQVEAGDIIGLGGSTGRSSGPHLHLEIRYLGAALNPEDVIDFSKFELKNETLEITKNSFRKTSRHSNSSLAKNDRYKSTKSGRYYTVRKGDTLSSIAQRNNTTVRKLTALNNIKGNQIRAGQKLKIR